MLGLHFCARAFSSCGKRGSLFIAVRGPLIIAGSLVAEHRLQTRRFSSCGSRAQLLRGMWDFPRPGLEPVSPALAGRFSTTAPTGKPKSCIFWNNFLKDDYKKKWNGLLLINEASVESTYKLFFIFCHYFLSLLLTTLLGNLDLLGRDKHLCVLMCPLPSGVPSLPHRSTPLNSELF